MNPAKLATLAAAFPSQTVNLEDPDALAAGLATLATDSKSWPVIGAAWGRHIAKRQTPHAGPGRPRRNPDNKPAAKTVTVSNKARKSTRTS